MRQAWINQLRKLLAELLTRTRSYLVTNRGLVQEQRVTEYERIAALGEEIELMLNPTEAQHQDLAAAVKRLSNSVWPGGKPEDFAGAQEQVKTLARSILKAEWNRTKAGD